MNQSPGPGSYALDVKERVQKLNEHFAHRYKANPFGSNLKRFEGNQSESSPKYLRED
jgi:hypothetical protein